MFDIVKKQLMLPLSKVNLIKAETNPYMFVDTGIPALFEQLVEQENVSPKGNWQVKAIGCGNLMGRKEVFKIGERNYFTRRPRFFSRRINNGELAEIRTSINESARSLNMS